MEAGYSEEKFKQHIRTVVAAAESDSLEERPLTLDELRELAISMGMAPHEWDELQKKATIHLKSAQDHLRARNFDEAISEAEQATSINPYIANGNSVLAKSYQMLWLEDDNQQAREKAEYYARKELLTDPNDQVAINVLSAINKKKKIAGKDSKSKKLYLYIGLAVALVVIIGYFFSSSSNERAKDNQLENNLIEAQEEVYSKYDAVQTAIDQRNKMLPDLFGAVSSSQGNIAALDAEISELNQQAKNTEGEARFKIEASIDEKIREAKSIVNQYGSAETIELLMVQIEGAENRIAFEKKAYNDAVKSYNILVKKSKGEIPGYELEPYYNAE